MATEGASGDTSEEILGRARKYLTESDSPGPLVKVEHQVGHTAEENRTLHNELAFGRLYIGEYHAQLALDNIFMTDLKSRRQQELDDLDEQERQLDTRLDYLFVQCQRLSDDNDRIVVEGKAKDAELGELHNQLELQNTKYRSLQKGVRVTQGEQAVANKQLYKATEQKRVSRQKLIRQHERLWELQDTIEGLKEDIAKMQGMLKKGTRLDPLDVDEEDYSSMRREDSFINRLEGNTAGGGGEKKKRNACQREDCAVLRAQLKETQGRIQQLQKRQQQLQAASTRGSLSFHGGSSSMRGGGAASSLTASVASRSLNSSRTGRRKSTTTFII